MKDTPFDNLQHNVIKQYLALLIGMTYWKATYIEKGNHKHSEM